MATPAEVDLLLVRCSRTEWDEAGRLGGDCDLPACKAWGEELTQALHDRELSTITAILTSPDEASAQTADHIGRLVDTKVRKVDDLREVDLGLWEGQRFDELKDRFRGAFAQWEEDPSSIVPPEAEPLADAEYRLLGALAKAMDKLNGKGRHVAVVLRPVAFHVVANRLRGMEPSEGWDPAASGPMLLGLRVKPDEIAPARAV
ncbi:MAG: histidine phosphatase family protein [Phycisphaerales bacterium]|nr:histidine phosphatase family protein [Phycisphaerales bacterium]